MILSIFSKSKPINFFITFLITVLALLVAIYKYGDYSIVSISVPKQVAIIFCIFLSALLIDFIVVKNALSQKSNVETLLFSLFLLFIPQVFLDWKIVFSNFLVLLALRRILSLRTQSNHIKKLFDAGFFLALASLFYFWALLFFSIIFVALLFYAESDIKKWLVSTLGLITVAILSVSFSLIVKDNFFSALNTNTTVSFNFETYNHLQFIVTIVMLISFGLWSSIFYLRDIKKKKKTFRPAYKVIFASFNIALILISIAPKKTGGEFLFLFAPLAIIVSNFIEGITVKWFKVIFVGLIIATPIIVLML